MKNNEIIEKIIKERRNVRAFSNKKVSKKVTSKRQDNYIEGRLGLIIDGTGADYDRISNQKTKLDNIELVSPYKLLLHNFPSKDSTTKTLQIPLDGNGNFLINFYYIFFYIHSKYICFAFSRLNLSSYYF